MGSILVGLQATRADVAECHVNVWTLPGWPNQLHLIDIGLCLKNTSRRPIRSFQLGIPVRAQESDATCLVSRISDLQTWQLIFRDCEEIRHGSGAYWHHTLIRASQRTFRMTNVTLVPERTLHRPKAEFSLWKVTLGKSLPPGQQTYIRVRFRIKRTPRGLGMLAISRDLGIYERVRTYDIRVNEIREQVDVDSVVSLFTGTPKIQRTVVFLVTDSRYTPRIVYPTPRYVRLLEGKAWQGYLQRRLQPFGLGPRPRPLIYSWAAEDITEYRAFASFNKDLGRMDVPTVSITALVSLFALALTQPHLLKDAATAMAHFFFVAHPLAAATAALAVIACLVARFVNAAARAVDTLAYGTTIPS